MGIVEGINRIRRRGFTLEVVGDQLMVEPFSALSDVQLGWLKANKQAILDALRSPGTVLTADRGHDLAAANCPLPVRLATAAERLCREVHGDSDDQVQEMLDDLAHCPPDDWDSLADHFESQLPPPPEEGRERITLQTDAYQFDMDVPTEHVAEFKARASVRFRLKDGGGGGSVLGEPGTPREVLVADLHTRYGSRLATIDGAEVTHAD